MLHTRENFIKNLSIAISPSNNIFIAHSHDLSRHPGREKTCATIFIFRKLKHGS